MNSFYLAALTLSLALAALGWGIYLTLKIFNIPDITTDGSYTLGAAITAFLISHQVGVEFALLITILAGALAGLITGLIHTRLKVNPLLAGILVMTALYSVNLKIMGRSNIPLALNGNLFYKLSDPLVGLFYLALIATLIFLFLWWMLKTDLGIAMRATGNSPQMVRAMGVSDAGMKCFGLAIANSLTALSGALVAQLQLFADISMGIGIVIFGLGAVMIGDALTKILGFKSIPAQLIGVLLGCILFRFTIALALQSGVDPTMLRLLTAGVVLFFVSIPFVLQWKQK